MAVMNQFQYKMHLVDTFSRKFYRKSYLKLKVQIHFVTTLY